MVTMESIWFFFLPLSLQLPDMLESLELYGIFPLVQKICAERMMMPPLCHLGKLTEATPWLSHNGSSQMK